VPTYQYTCTECGEPLEEVQKFSDDPLTVCPVCGGKLRKVFSAVGIVFKGSGFYRNDSRKVPAEAGANGAKKEGAAASTESSAGAASGSSSGDSSGKSGESSGKSGESSGKSGESSGKSGKSGESSGSSSGEKKPESARAKSASSSDTKVA
jgi:putative FmdB family regulatory protein